MKALYLLSALALICSCTSGREQTVSAGCDAAMFGLYSSVEEVAYINCYGDYYDMFITAKFDTDGNIIIPITDKVERDEYGRIIKYERNFANPGSEDYARYDITYSEDTNSFLPMGWAYETPREIGENKLIYDGVIVKTSHGSYSEEGGYCADYPELKYDYVKFDKHGNWTKRTVTGKENVTEYEYDDDMNKIPSTWEWEVSYTTTRTIKYRK